MTFEEFLMFSDSSKLLLADCFGFNGPQHYCFGSVRATLISIVPRHSSKVFPGKKISKLVALLLYNTKQQAGHDDRELMDIVNLLAELKSSLFIFCWRQIVLTVTAALCHIILPYQLFICQCHVCGHDCIKLNEDM